MRRMRRMAKNTKIADIVTIFIILVPIFLLSLEIIIDSSQRPNILNVLIYLTSISAIYIGMLVRGFAERKQTRQLWILSFVLTALGIFTPMFLAQFVLKDVVSLALAALISVPIFLVFLILG